MRHDRRRVRGARHRRQQRGLHVGRDRPQDERRAVPRDARDPHGRAVPDPQGAAPHLREPAKQEAAEGREVFRKVVNVTSIAGTQGNVGQANYSAAKAGLVGLTKTLAREWGPLKVNVNAVAFGFVETRLTAAPARARRRSSPAVEIPLGIPEQMREMASRSSRSAARRRPRRRPGRSSSSARPGRTSSTARYHRQRRPDDGDDRETQVAELCARRDRVAGADVRYEVTGRRSDVRRRDRRPRRRRDAARSSRSCRSGTAIAPASRSRRDRRGAQAGRPLRARTWCCTGRSRPE